MSRLIDLTGQRFGRLTVIGPYYRRTDKTFWPCNCDCGRRTDVWADYLRRGTTRSCGCLSRDAVMARNLKHGKAQRGPRRAPEYTVWVMMRNRCSKPDAFGYESYGGRGITVCDRWQSFENFYADMGPRPTPKHQIDRIDNDGDYAPDNCRWVTRVENCNNTRRNVHLTFMGETLTISDWGRRTGIGSRLLWARINQLGWSVGQALTTPVRNRKKPAPQAT